MGTSCFCCKHDTTLQGAYEMQMGYDTNTYEGTDSKTLRNNTFSAQSIPQKEISYHNVNTEINEEHHAKKFTIFSIDVFMKNYLQENSLKFMKQYSYDISPSNEERTEKLSIIKKKNLGQELLLNIYRYSSDPVLSKTQVRINPQGLVGSKRNAIDGYTFFNMELKPNSAGNPNNSNISTKNDYTFEINRDECESDEGINTLLIPNCTMFVIKFDPENLKYQIRDLYSGSGIFMKITNETVLKENSLISLGDTYIIISQVFKYQGVVNHVDKFNSQSGGNINMINIKIFNKNNHQTHDPINFEPSKSVIKVGRSKENEICIADNLVSKFHFTIQFDKVVGWTIRDGYFSKSKNKKNEHEYLPSANGTWLHVGDGLQIVDGAAFKCNFFWMECELTKASNK